MRNIVSNKYGLLILLILLVFLAVTYFALRQRQDIRKQAVEPALDIVVGTDPIYKIVAQNQPFTVKLDMKNTSLNTKVISGAQASIDIDTSRYDIESITCGDDFTQGFDFISTPTYAGDGLGKNINIFCAIQPNNSSLIIGSGTNKTLAKINLKVKPNAWAPKSYPQFFYVVKIKSVRITQAGEPASGFAYNIGKKGDDAYFNIVSPDTNAIGVYPLHSSTATDNKCNYFVSWILSPGVTGKVTFQHTGEPVVNWCPTTTGENACATWKLPVIAQTPKGKTTTFRLYNEGQPTVVLDTAVFTCTGTAVTPTVTAPTPTDTVLPTVTPTATPPNPANTVTPTTTQVPLNPINWTTGWVSLQADDFFILVDGVKYTGQSADLSLNSDPPSTSNFDYTTLEAIWHENNKEMRLFIYFYKNSTHWWSNEIRTYNNQNPGNWIYHRGEFFKSPLGTVFNENYSIGNTNILNSMVEFKNLRLTAFNTPACNKKSTGDANCDGNINGRDYSIWLRSQCSRNCLDKRADFNSDSKVDEADRQIWIDNRS